MGVRFREWGKWGKGLLNTEERKKKRGVRGVSGCNYLDRNELLGLGLDPAIAEALLAGSGLTGNDRRKVVEVVRAEELAALNLVVEADPSGWYVIRRPGHNLAARGGTLNEALARLFALQEEFREREAAPIQRGLFDALL